MSAGTRSTLAATRSAATKTEDIPKRRPAKGVPVADACSMPTCVSALVCIYFHVYTKLHKSCARMHKIDQRR